MSTVEQMMLVALSDDGDDLARIARQADQLERDIATLVRMVDHVLARLPATDPTCEDLHEIRKAALIAVAKIERLTDHSCKPNLWLVP